VEEAKKDKATGVKSDYTPLKDMAAVTVERANIKHVFYQGIFTSAEASYNDSVQDTATNHDEMAKIDADIALA